MSDDIDVTGLKLWDMLAALYNATEPLGMGVLQPRSGEDMTPSEAYQLLNLDECEDRLASPYGLSFDYLRGRPIKVTFKQVGATTMLQQTWAFDRDSLRSAASVIDDLRKLGVQKTA